MVVNDCLGMFYVPITYFGFWQFKNMFVSGGIYAFSGFSALVFVLAAIALPLVWLGLWCKRTPEEVHSSLWFLTLRVRVPEGEEVVVHD